MARGFIPDGRRSSPKSYKRGLSETPSAQVSGLLRSPSGINPLTTMNLFVSQMFSVYRQS
ncbi:hypothetical protein EMIT093MI4_60261 [Pseudomonas sp. IT-93MI4]